MKNCRLRVLDLESTGVDTANDRIVTAYVGELDAFGNVIGGREWLIRPDGFEIPAGATAVHGITTKYAREHGQDFAEAMSEIAVALTGSGVAVSGHNLAYDMSLLAHELHRAGYPDPVELIESLNLVDTYVIDKQLVPYRRGSGMRKLTAIAELYGVTLSDEDAHGAQADAVASGRVALAMLDGELGDLDPADLHTKQRGWYRAQAASFEAHKRQTLKNFTLDRNWPLHAPALALAVPAETPTF